MSVEIKIYGETAKEALRELADLASGSQRRVEVEWVGPVTSEVGGADQPDPEPVKSAAETLDLTEKVEAPKRERGKPAPGRARRTKEEIAEDDAADAADAQTATANISTGEDRVDPAQQDSAEDAAQDAADEAEEVEKTRDAEKPLTNDDLRAEMTLYVNTYGMPAVQEDGTRIFQAALGAPPAGEAAWKLSTVGNDQERLQKAVAAWKQAIEINPYKRDRVAK
jgi:hypothetical protein